MGTLKDDMSDLSRDADFMLWETSSKLRGQWLIAVLAALSSMVIHGMIAWVGSRVDFSYIMGTDDVRPRREFERMTVDRVELPEDVSSIVDTLRTLQDPDGLDLQFPLNELAVSPDEASIEPPSIRTPEVEPDLSAIMDRAAEPLEMDWQPRQEIVAIESRAVAEIDETMPRREIPMIERVPDAPDIAFPAEIEDIPDVSGGMARVPVPGVADISDRMGPLPQPSPIMAEEEPVTLADSEDDEEELFEETPDEITDAEPIEDTLTAEIETYRREGEDYGYFRITIDRTGADVLPVMPKDILFVQDTSGTIADRRLHFSREGFRRGFAYIGAQDRFNVASFIDRTNYAFPEWQFRSDEADEQARQYFDSMTADGNTDFLEAMRDILSLEMDPERPVIVILATDGLMHSGITDNTEVIARFTRENAGRISIFSFGVADHANMYLLEMLSKFNMGDATYVKTGRWGIPDALEELIRSVSRPVLQNLRVGFGADAQVEGFPLRPGNLYLDRPLVLYGRYPLTEERLLVHAAGRSMGQFSDMVFDLVYPEHPAGEGDPTIRDGWSQQKIYDLIARFTKTRDRSYLREMSRLSRHYDQEIPFRTFFGF